MRADSSAATGVMVNSEHRPKNLVVTSTLVSWQVPITRRSLGGRQETWPSVWAGQRMDDLQEIEARVVEAA